MLQTPGNPEARSWCGMPDIADGRLLLALTFSTSIAKKISRARASSAWLTCFQLWTPSSLLAEWDSSSLLAEGESSLLLAEWGSRAVCAATHFHCVWRLQSHTCATQRKASRCCVCCGVWLLFFLSSASLLHLMAAQS